MKKTVFALSIIALMFVSCKKEDALSKVDPNSQDVQMNAINNPKNEIIANEQAAANVAAASNVTPPPADGKYPQMNFAKKEHDFGTIKEGDKVETSFTFVNNGEAPLTITSASGSCGCTVPDYPKDPIKPGESRKMKVSFDSTGKPGMQQKSVNITCNTEKGSEVLTIKANVTPKTAANSMDSKGTVITTSN